MARGLERCAICRDDWDRQDSVGRPAGLAAAYALAVYVWPGMPFCHP